MNGKFVYITGNAKCDAKKGKYVGFKVFFGGGVYGKYNNNKGGFSGVLYVTTIMCLEIANDDASHSRTGGGASIKAVRFSSGTV